MTEPTVWAFFYGSYMNRDVLREVDFVPEHVEPARLSGFDIRIEPLANLIRSTQHLVYGILATATHRELDRLYTEHAHGVLGGLYLPHPVLTETLEGHWRPALCYLSHTMQPAPATAEYVARIARPAREFNFPQWYVANIEQYARTPRGSTSTQTQAYGPAADRGAPR